jgi:hypothetical protein
MKVLSDKELSRLHELQVQKADLDTQINEQTKVLNRLRDARYKINEQVRLLSGKTSMPLNVTERALWTYCEHVLGMDRHEIERDILSGNAEPKVQRHYTVYRKPDCTLIVRGNMVTKVLEKDADV